MGFDDTGLGAAMGQAELRSRVERLEGYIERGLGLSRPSPPPPQLKRGRSPEAIRACTDIAMRYEVALRLVDSNLAPLFGDALMEAYQAGQMSAGG